MSRFPVSYVDISVFAHATEDPERVVNAALNIIPAEHAEKVTFKRKRLKGDYGNPIILFKARIEDEDLIKVFIGYIADKMTRLDKDRLLYEMPLRLDKGSLYIRFDKQAAFYGNLKFRGEDPIHIRIRFRKSRVQDIIEICEGLGLIDRSS